MKANKVYIFLRETELSAGERSIFFLPEAIALFCAKENIPNKGYYYAESGKPMISGGAFYISVSHTDNIFLAALSFDPIGIDAELRRSIKPEIAKRFFSAEEQKEDFFRIWCSKEACLKISGDGISGLKNCIINKENAEYSGKKYYLTEIKEYSGKYPDIEIILASEKINSAEYI